MDSHDETGCQARERPILCINNCGFFGRAATMNMCSKCYKDTLIKQEREKLVASSIDSFVNGSTSESNGKDPVVAGTGGALDLPTGLVETKTVVAESSSGPSSANLVPEAPKQGPTRCTTCRKRVGLTGFKCRCENYFCVAHRYSDKHDCPFDYRTAGRDAIAKANPVVKAEKLDKI